MKVALAQTRFKTADFDFNFNQIIKQVDNTDCDLIVFPQYDLDEIGGKDLSFDEKVQRVQCDFYEKIAEKKYDKAILIGDVLIQNGEINLSDDGFYIVCGKNIYVDDIYRDDVVCDLYILAKNKYFVMESYKEFIESINSRNDFIFVNAVGMSDESIFAGGSFAKNRENEIVKVMPICRSACEVIDFLSPVDFVEPEQEELVYEVIKFGLREYCENTGFKKVVLGLSGGIDSALTAVLAADAIGAENVLGIMMPSMYSSEGSVMDSVRLAQNIGIKTEKHAITHLFENFMDKVGHEKRQDLAEENLQARLRALILMFFSNRDNRLLLSTSNKSEAAMGFGTLYGDLAGGLNLICDLTKTNVYKLSNYINREVERIPQEIIDKAPSAELHPGQKDQDRLPEYAVLDDIIEMYVEKNVPIEEISEKYGTELVQDTVKKIYRAQFKRKQCCLGLRLTERSFCRGVDYPIMQRFY